MGLGEAWLERGMVEGKEKGLGEQWSGMGMVEGMGKGWAGTQ